MDPIRSNSFLPKIYGSGQASVKKPLAEAGSAELDSFDFSEHLTANLKPLEKALYAATSYEPALMAGLGGAIAGQFGIMAGLVGGVVGFVIGLDGNLGGPIARSLEELSFSRGRGPSDPRFLEVPARMRETMNLPRSTYTHRPSHVSPEDAGSLTILSSGFSSRWASKIWSQVERLLPNKQSKTP